MLSNKFLESLKTVKEVEEQIYRTNFLIVDGMGELYRKLLEEELRQLEGRKNQLLLTEIKPAIIHKNHDPINSSPSYRNAMIDAGRGRLLP